LEDTINRFEDYAYQILNAKGTQVNITLPHSMGEIKLPLAIRRALMLIMKEAVTNAAKHSEAKKVDVNITFDKNKKLLKFKMVDNGKGFDLNNMKSGNGLINMRRRTKEMKGKITIKSSPGKGMSLLLQLPV